MGDTTISWTNKVWNPLVGCRKVSPGCARCYAERMANRQVAMARAKIAKGQDPGRSANYMQVIDDKGRWNGRIVTVPDALVDPFSWRTPCMVFVNSMSDLFHEAVPFEFIDQVFAVMALTPQHTYQCLTKRPDRAADYLTRTVSVPFMDYYREKQRREFVSEALFTFLVRECRPQGKIPVPSHVATMGQASSAPSEWPLTNVHLGTSPCNQKTLDESVPHLLRCPAAVRWLSIEPMLGPVDLSQFMHCLDWAVLGCESVGKSVGRLSADRTASESEWLQWAVSIVEQCHEAGVPVHVKQIPSAGKVEHDIANFPPALRFQEYPRAGSTAAE